MKSKALHIVTAFFLCIFAQNIVKAQLLPNSGFDDKFRQIEELLPTPNDQRAASGAPGAKYWQQRADYKMKISIDDDTQVLSGIETITYYNNSPDALGYLWLQLDQNRYEKESDGNLISQQKMKEGASESELLGMIQTYDGGFKIEKVLDANGKPLLHFINKTMMRIELPTTLQPGKSVSFQIQWWYNINNRAEVGGRSGYEFFEKENNYIYTIAQFFPRMCAYYDVYGWQHKQFLGAGEFTLEFGTYDVEITVPSNHLVGASGVLQNANAVLSAEQRARLEKAKNERVQPVMIVTPLEALNAESQKLKTTKTWRFVAENVRDFAFVSSKKFIWDAMGVPMKSGVVLAMSYYPKEGNPLWEQYSTKAVAHTLKWYSHYTIDYPYPVAISVHTDRIGMEYPMICFNGGRPEADGTYSERTKYGMISVIIHEVGHNYFPMIINSDERQWTWMDEGLNSYVQFLTEQQWDINYPSYRGPARNIVGYMKGDVAKLEPIMTNSESLRQFGNNAYGKAATGLNILRESVLGRENFDYAFKTYAERWKFKRPTPADFFRSMEDASGTDLDWFWRGWFYTIDNCDIAIKSVVWRPAGVTDPEADIALAKAERERLKRDISAIRNREEIKRSYVEQDSTLLDFYSRYEDLKATDGQVEKYKKYMGEISGGEAAKVPHFYQVTFERVGELVMPIIVELQYEDGTSEVKRIPAEIWRLGDKEVTKVFNTQKVVKQFVLDPYLETADIDVKNNYFPERQLPTRFERFKETGSGNGGGNPMQKAIATPRPKPEGSRGSNN